MTVFHIYAVPASILLALVMYALCAAASEADRQEEMIFDEWECEHEERDL